MVHGITVKLFICFTLRKATVKYKSIHIPPKALSIMAVSETLQFSFDFLIRHAKWVFLSNRLVSYWPLSIQPNSHIFATPFKFKSLQFKFSYHCQMLTSLAYILLNISYTLYYFLFKFHEDSAGMHHFDLILITTWDMLIVVGGIVQRVYALTKVSAYKNFWIRIGSVVHQSLAVGHNIRNELKFYQQLKTWTLKWISGFAFLGLINAIAVFYHYAWIEKEKLETVAFYEYLELVVSMQNSSTLVHIFFIKVMNLGYSVCRTKLDWMTRLLYFDPRKFGIYSRKEEVIFVNMRQILNLLDQLEQCVHSYNQLFGFTLLLETVFTFWHVMFAMYFLHTNPIENVAFAVNMAMPIVMYPVAFVSLCRAATQMTVECQEVIAGLHRIPRSVLSKDHAYQVCTDAKLSLADKLVN